MSHRLLAPQTLERAADAFGLDAEALVFVRDVANLVYADAEPASCFLRLTHESDRSAPDVAAEIDWLRFLVHAGLPVCQPRKTRDGALWSRPGEGFTAVTFERVRGLPCAFEEYEAPMLERMGAFIGRLHRVSAGYEPARGAPQRLHWHELDSPERVLRSWAPEDTLVAECFTPVFERLRDAVFPDERYGLIHGDVHRGNVFVHEDGIEVYDFDDCCRAPLAMDVAHALYYSLWERRYLPEPEREALARSFLDALLRGYRREHPFPDSEIAWLPDLLEYRELAVDAFSHRRRQPDEETVRRWAHLRERLARGAPYVALSS